MSSPKTDERANCCSPKLDVPVVGADVRSRLRRGGEVAVQVWFEKSFFLLVGTTLSFETLDPLWLVIVLPGGLVDGALVPRTW
jgi:hypothetical protein